MSEAAVAKGRCFCRTALAFIFKSSFWESQFESGLKPACACDMTIALAPGDATSCLMKNICICIALSGFDKFGEHILYKLSGDSED